MADDVFLWQSRNWKKALSRWTEKWRQLADEAWESSLPWHHPKNIWEREAPDTQDGRGECKRCSTALSSLLFLEIRFPFLTGCLYFSSIPNLKTTFLHSSSWQLLGFSPNLYHFSNKLSWPSFWVCLLNPFINQTGNFKMEPQFSQ